MGGESTRLQNSFSHPLHAKYVMPQLCVKVRVDDGSLSIAVLVHVGFNFEVITCGV